MIAMKSWKQKHLFLLDLQRFGKFVTIIKARKY